MIVGLTIVLFVIFVAFSTIKQKLYFRPDTNVSSYPDDVPNIMIDEQIHAWHIQSPTSKTILYCPGNAGNIGGRLHVVDQWNQQGFSVLMFDYPGYGLSKGYPTENSLYESGEQCMEYLLRTVKSKDIIVFGESIGCSVAAHLAQKYDVDRVVFQSGFSSMKDVVRHYIPVYLDWMLPFFPEFSTYDKLKKHQGELMILHSREDKIIPFSNAEKLGDFTTNIYEINGSHNRPQFEIDKVAAFMNGT
jgi:esterase/lipase